jgi:uncharacterized DUF497 family protein
LSGDDRKAIEDFANHGVTFGEATEVIHDPNAVEGEVAEHSFDEARFVIIGFNQPHAVRGLC